jgi:hypothetical protein
MPTLPGVANQLTILAVVKSLPPESIMARLSKKKLFAAMRP